MFQSITQTKNVNKILNKLLICKKRKLLFFFLFLVTAKLPSDRQRQSTLRTSISLSWECLNPERSPSRGSFEYKAELQRKGRQSHPAQTPRSVKVVCESRGGSTVGRQDQHGAEDAHVMSDQLHLVPELHLACVVPVAEVAVDEQDHQRQDDGQNLSRQADVAAGEEGQSQHPKQHLQQHEGDLSSDDVVQIRLLVLFAVLQRVHLVEGKWYCVI